MPYPRKINFLKLLLALSKALDLTTSGLSKHHQMVALASMEMASLLGINREEKENLFCSAIIHDIGISSSKEKASIMNYDIDTPKHAIIGCERLKGSPLLYQYAETVKHHHDHWDGTTQELKGVEIPRNSRIIFIVDRLTTLINNEKLILGQEKELIAHIERLSGKAFQPMLVDCLKEMILKEGFLLDITTDFMPRLLDEFAPVKHIEVNMEDLIDIANIFASVIDNKSPYTKKHSKNVAKISVFLAKKIGFSQKEIWVMEIAALLHDTGKLSVPDEILDKPGKLSPEEFNTMRGHTYFTYQILKSIDDFDVISEWAAFHHEKLNGVGYPFHLKDENISLGSRVIAVSDIFSALSEDRPYRKALNNDEIITELEKMVNRGDIDGVVVSVLKENIEEIRGLIKKEV